MEIRVYDGGDTIGGNKIYVREKKRGVFLDFGMNFAKYSKFYDGFLRERPSRGIYDLWALGLIPKVDVYRQDLIPTGIDLSDAEKLKVDAVLISHAHMDHVGNVGLLRREIPVVLSPETLAILKAYRDMDRTGIGGEVPYFSPREAIDGGYVLTSKPSSDYLGRKIVLTEKCEKLEEFVFKRPTRRSRGREVKEGEISYLDEADLGFEVKAFELDHSIFGSLGFILEGDTSLAYTGDFRFSGRRGRKNRRFFSEAKNCGILVIEGTRIRGVGRKATEREVYERAREIVEGENGIVIVTIPEGNFERLETFRRIARETGRDLVISERKAYTIYCLKRAGKKINWKGTKIFKVPSAQGRGWKEVLREFLGEDILSSEDIRRNQQSVILCLSTHEIPYLLDVKPSSGSYIYSSSEAFEEEQRYDFLRLKSWIDHFGLSLYGFEVKEGGRLEFDPKLHSSGHASREEISRIVELVDPDVIVPVHTDSPEEFLKMFGEREVWVKGANRS